jgi:hypothetical protein
VAAPVRDASGQVVAVIHVSAPSMRMRPPRPRALVAAVIDAAAKLSQALGAFTPTPAGTGADDAAPPPAWPVGTPPLEAARPHSILR